MAYQQQISYPTQNPQPNKRIMPPLYCIPSLFTALSLASIHTLNIFYTDKTHGLGVTLPSDVAQPRHMPHTYKLHGDRSTIILKKERKKGLIIAVIYRTIYIHLRKQDILA